MIWQARPPDAPQPRTARRRWLGLCIVLAAFLASAFLGRDAAGWWARREAARELRTGAIGPAEELLARADRFDPNDDRNDLLRAACFRHLRNREAWTEAVRVAERNGARGEALQRELRLGDLHFGAVERILPTEFDSLVQSGIPPREAATAMVFGLLAHGRSEQAEDLIRTWAEQMAGQAQVSYLRGSCQEARKQRDAARAEFETTLKRQPQHEPARSALGRLLEENDDLAGAHAQQAALAVTAPHRESVRVDLARVLRKLGRLEHARAALGDAAREDVSASVAIELAEIEYEAGNYNEATRWFERADLDAAHFAETLRAAASAFALRGDVLRAEFLFGRVDDVQSSSRRSDELQDRLAVDPGDRAAAEELRHLLNSAPAAGIKTSTAQVSSSYLQHCAACHGSEGDGGGRAARHLYPPPRNLRAGSLRLVSTSNRVATLGDIKRVIRRGIPGTAMPAFAELPADEQTHLARQVQQFQREGARERVLGLMRDAREAINEQELRRIVADLTAPGEVLEAPDIGRSSAESIARGRDLFIEVGCRGCHGDDGTGNTDVLIFDEQQRPVVARDLVRDPMKGGSDAQSLYRRIRLGMPGTPHPAAATLDPADLMALVDFCRSLSREPKRNLTNHQRATRAAQHASSVLRPGGG